MTKSGSTFAFQIARAICQRHLDRISGKLFTVKDVFPDTRNVNFLSHRDDLIEFTLQAYDLVGRDPDKILIAKLHQRCLPKVQKMISACKVWSIATFRHPEEIALSLVDSSSVDRGKGKSRFRFFSPRETVKHIESNIANYKTWNKLNNNLNIFFDELVINPYHVAAKMKNHFGFEIAIGPVVDFFLKDKEKRIGEYNKGIVDRHKLDFPSSLKGLFGSKFNDFIIYVNEFKTLVQNE